MKKLFSLVFVFILGATLFACEDTQEKAYDGTVTFALNVGGETTEKTVGYIESDETNLFDLLLAHFEVQYDETDFGPYIKAINDLEIAYGNYIQLVHNGEPATVGINSLSFEDGDVITFELAWFDERARQTREIIELFLAHHVDDYMGESQNIYVVSGLYHLDLLDDFNAPEAETTEGLGQLIRLVQTRAAFNQDTTEAANDLLGEADFEWPYTAALIMMALSQSSVDYSTLESTYLDQVGTMDFAVMDLDTLSMVLLSLITLDATQTHGQAILDVLESNLYLSSYGDNGATFSHVVMALIAMALDPSADDYDKDDVAFIDVFLTYHAGDGSFYYQLDNDTADTLFTTPQAFLALVLYERFLNDEADIHPFIYE